MFSLIVVAQYIFTSNTFLCLHYIPISRVKQYFLYEVSGDADIQLLLEGSESIGICPISHLAEKPVIDEEKDCTFFEDLDGSLMELAPGEFIIALPQDIHKPNCPGSKSSRSKKMVFKVLLDE